MTTRGRAWLSVLCAISVVFAPLAGAEAQSPPPITIKEIAVEGNRRVQEAVILGRLLKARAADADPLDGLAAVFFAEIQGVLEAPWGVATSDFIYPKTRGERPANFEQRMQFNFGLVRLGAEDPSVQKLLIEVSHLLKPNSALRSPEISERVARLMATSA